MGGPPGLRPARLAAEAQGAEGTAIPGHLQRSQKRTRGSHHLHRAVCAWLHERMLAYPAASGVGGTSGRRGCQGALSWRFLER
jgi:hypothetical protein